jgi:hypothetical protein
MGPLILSRPAVTTSINYSASCGVSRNDSQDQSTRKPNPTIAESFSEFDTNRLKSTMTAEFRRFIRGLVV